MSDRTFHAPIRLGISTCPNDTFAFHGLLNHEVDWRGLEFQVELLDIQQLNNALFAGEFDIAKASFHAALRLASSCFILPSGSALGFGVGPLLLAAESGILPQPGNAQRTLCPGEHTTAALLFQLFYPGCTRLEHVVFSEIMPSLQNKTADFGVCIHEGRFTWQREGLALVEDLGTRWERETKCPLPLGGILARRRLSNDVIGRVQAVIRDSIDFALSDPSAAMPTMRTYSQEFDEEVLMQHVHLYVNEWTRDLGVEGRLALAELSRQAVKHGISSADEPIEIFG